MAEKKYIYYKMNSVYDLLIHTGIVVALTGIIILFFFNSFLPSATYHGETVTVPDLVGMPVSDIKDFLKRRDLDFTIQDSSYSRKHNPHEVLTQSPEPGARVKRNRKIQITINPQSPPMVRMPKLIDMPFSEALRTLRNRDLQLGKFHYKEHLAKDVILEQYVDGRKFKEDADFREDYLIPKGTRIDLLIADGVGDTEFAVPDLVGLPYDEALFVIEGHKLILGNVKYDMKSKRELGTVIRQTPPVYLGKLRKGVKAGSLADDRERNVAKAGEIIDLWVSGNPAADPDEDWEEEEEEELDEEEQRRRDSLETPQNYYDLEELKRVREKRLKKNKKDNNKSSEEKPEKENDPDKP